MTTLELDNISHAFGDLLAVDDVSLSLGQGEVVSLLGPSGCGKTTVLRVAAGLERLQRGRVRINGKVVADERSDLAPEHRDVGLVFQDYALFPHLSVAGNVAFGLKGRQNGAVREKVMASLDQVGMGDYAEAFPHMLSGGQQQRVALARALAPEPQIMLLDEPFSGLDTTLRNQVRDDALRVLKENKTATLLVTHDPEEAMFMADRIAVMQRGKILQLGAPSELYCVPHNGFVAGFFGEINRLKGHAVEGSVATPFGPVPNVQGGKDGPVELLIRPEAVKLDPCEQADAARPDRAEVLSARLLGRSSLLYLKCHDLDGGEVHLQARAPGNFQPEPGQILTVRLDLAQTFVFPLEHAK